MNDPLDPAEAAGRPVFGSIGALGAGFASVVVVCVAPGLYCGSAAHGSGASLVSASRSEEESEFPVSYGTANGAAAAASSAIAAITITARMWRRSLWSTSRPSG